MQAYAASSIAPLRDFVQSTTRLVERAAGERALLVEASDLMKKLIARDDWLPDEFATPDPLRYQQYLLFADPLDRFAIVSFVWGPGQHTPIHDHTVWGIVGVLRGAECAQRYRLTDQGPVAEGDEQRLDTGDVEIVSPTLGDIHRVRNAFDDRSSISIHVYGGNIGRIARHVFAPGSPDAKPFVSGYSNTTTPNLS
jgi:predicted metal-dependent enzyme (double-stranded beta helix superfamily)